jgi:predicted nucleic acid-binding protein
MREVFADTNYWIALLNKKDQLHSKAREVSEALDPKTFIITSHLVLGEVIEHFRRSGDQLKSDIIQMIGSLEEDSFFAVEPMSPKLFDDTLSFLHKHLDQEWGFVDCSSFVIMKRRRISEALSYDKHFVQAGYKALLRD